MKVKDFTDTFLELRKRGLDMYDLKFKSTTEKGKDMLIDDDNKCVIVYLYSDNLPQIVINLNQ